MTEQPQRSTWRRIGYWIGRCWSHVFDLALILWVARVPVASVVLGLLILGKAPQAQDLFVELAGAKHRRDFLVLVPACVRLGDADPLRGAACCSTPTGGCRAYAEHAERGCRQSSHSASMERWVPRILGLLTFVAVLIAIMAVVREPASISTKSRSRIAIGWSQLFIGSLVSSS